MEHADDRENAPDVTGTNDGRDDLNKHGDKGLLRAR